MNFYFVMRMCIKKLKCFKINPLVSFMHREESLWAQKIKRNSIFCNTFTLYALYFSHPPPIFIFPIYFISISCATKWDNFVSSFFKEDFHFKAIYIYQSCFKIRQTIEWNESRNLMHVKKEGKKISMKGMKEKKEKKRNI